MGRLSLSPITIKAATQFVRAHHRHSRPPSGGLFAVGVRLDGSLVGVAIAGRPVSRVLDDGGTIEITRCCTIGEKNACSMLYGALCRAATALGYDKAITYTRATEEGISLIASGFVWTARVKASSWDRPNRTRVVVASEVVEKVRWERQL